MINLAVAGLPFEEAQCDWVIQGFNTKGGEVARDESKKFEVAPKLISVDTRVRETRETKEIRKRSL